MGVSALARALLRDYVLVLFVRFVLGLLPWAQPISQPSDARRRPQPSLPEYLCAGGRLRATRSAADGQDARRRPAAVDLAAPTDGDVAVEATRRRGRGAQSNASGRYESVARTAFDDGWQSFEELPPFKTTVTIDATRKIITRNDRPTFPSTARSIPIAAASTAASIASRGRPTPISACRRASISRSKLFAKPDAPKLLERELSAAELRRRAPSPSAPTPIPTSRSSASTRSCARILEVLERCRPSGRHRDQVGAGAARPRHPRAHGRAQSGQGRAVGDARSIRKLARVMEPRAATPARRLEALRAAGRRPACRPR